MRFRLFSMLAAIILMPQSFVMAQVNVTAAPDTGTPIAVRAVRPAAIGADTAGAIVRVTYLFHYAGLRGERAFVLPTSSGDGEAQGGVDPLTGRPLWRLLITGDTAANPWVFEGLTPSRPGLYEIDTIEIDTLPSSTAFDRVSLLGRNTRGSMGGITFGVGLPVIPGYGPDAVQYRYVNPLWIPSMSGPATPCGDLFGKLELKFSYRSGAPGGFDGQSWIEFEVDSDRFRP